MNFAVSGAVVWNSPPTDLQLLLLPVPTFAEHAKNTCFLARFSASEDRLFYALLLLLGDTFSLQFL